jgi:hypothetical protein
MILTRGNATGPTRFGEIEWEWRKKSGEAGSMPTAEDAGADVAQVYDEVRAAIALGETMFPRGATSTDKSMQRYHSGWKETHGLYQTNKALRGGHEVEYEAFFGQDVADGLQEAWKRPMHWAGFLVMGASTRLPRGGMESVDSVKPFRSWCASEVAELVRSIGSAFADKANQIDANGIDGEFFLDMLTNNDANLTTSIAEGGLGFSGLQVNLVSKKIEKLG